MLFLADHAAARLPCVFWIHGAVLEAAGVSLIGLPGAFFTVWSAAKVFSLSSTDYVA